MLKLFDFVCKSCGKEFELLYDNSTETPKCECGSEDLETSFLNFKLNYKLLYNPKTDKVGWANDGYATSQYWRAMDEARGRGEDVIPADEATGQSINFKKD